MSGVLEGIKVLSMGLVVAAPAASAWLADWGAEVIKIEPLTGDTFRGVNSRGRTTMVFELNGVTVGWAFQLMNRNKKSLAVDLKTDSGREILYKLVKKADVFLSNYKSEALSNLKLDYASLSKINPGIIYAGITGYGTVGPDKNEPGYDVTAAWARSGVMYQLGEPGSIPSPQRPGQMDTVAAAHAVAGITAALLNRERTGKGQEVELSLFHSGVWTLSVDTQGALVGKTQPKITRSMVQNPLWNSYRTKDDRWIQLGMLQPDPYWPGFCRAIGKPELENDPRFNSILVRRENCKELINIIGEVFATKTMAGWEKLFKENNVIYGRVQNMVEVTIDPQAIANDFFVEMEHPAGKMKVVSSPVKFYQNPGRVRGPAPELGQHNEEILLALDYSWDDIARLKEQGAIL